MIYKKAIQKRQVEEIKAIRSDAMDRALLRRIVINSKIMLGKPVIKGTRLPVELIVEKIAYGETIEDLKRDYPFLTEDDIKAALLYAAKRLAHEEVFAA